MCRPWDGLGGAKTLNSQTNGPARVLKVSRLYSSIVLGAFSPGYGFPAKSTCSQAAGNAGNADFTERATASPPPAEMSREMTEAALHEPEFDPTVIGSR